MIDITATDDDLLRTAREHFEHCIQFYDFQREEWHRSSRFFHNTRREGQWDSEDLQYLRDQGRPALSFNLIRGKIETIEGMYRDGQRVPRVLPAGAADRFQAKVLDAVAERVRKNVNADRTDSEVLHRGLVMGQCNAHIDVQLDPDNPSMIEILYKFVSSFEVNWDPGAEEPDRSDARYVFYDRWLSQNEFFIEYPEMKHKYEELRISSDMPELSIFAERPHSAREPGLGWEERDYYPTGWSDTYYDRKRKRIRIIHWEVMVPKKRWFLVNPANGEKKEISYDHFKVVRDMAEAGYDLGGMEPIEIQSEECFWLEFAGATVLFRDWSPEPFDGFSLVPFTCYQDWETGEQYGTVRDLIDPQSEVNKAHSLSLDHLTAQNKPGIIAEKSAVDDPDELEEKTRTSGAVAIVNDGAISQKRLMERNPPNISPAAVQRLETATVMMDKVSGVQHDLSMPAAQQEAATTVQIRYHQARQGVSRIFSAFEDFQQAIYGKKLQTIVRVMPDYQIERMLGSNPELVVQDGVVLEVGLNPEDPTQKVVKQQASIRDVRSLEYDLELDNSSENTTLRLLELSGLTQLKQLGVPVDDELLLERSASSRADAERLVEFARQTTMQQARTAAAAAQQAAQQVEAALATEAAKAQEDSRSNRADEEFDRLKLMVEAQLKNLEIWERADEAEKDAMVKMAIENMRATRPAQQGA